jgi:chromosome segregation ATPase
LRAKKIEQHARVTEVTDDKTLLQSYREEIAELKSQLEQAREAQRRLEEQRTTQQAAPTIVDDDTREIEEAIIKMERLILKATSPTVTPRASSPAAIQSDEEEDELLNVLSGDSTDLTGPAPRTPARSLPVADGEQLVVELHRIQGLLGSVLTKRKVVASPPHRDEEMEQLRAQLYENEVATSLRKADSSFLQNQLIEKDNLLAEVSKILEALEKRQADLEAENRSLKDSLFRAKDALASERHEKDILKTRLERVEQTMEEREAQRVTNGVSYHH